MRKEILIAIFAGVVIGILVAFGVWRANSALLKRPPQNSQLAVSETKNEEKPGKEEKKNLDISFSNIQELDVLTESPISLNGLTSPETIVSISGEDEDYFLKSSANGSFEQKVDLKGGINQILLSAYNLDGKNVGKKLTVVFSTEFSKDHTGSDEQNSTQEGILQKVKEKVEAIRNSPKAYVGTVTDKTQESIQLKGTSGKIEQISVKDGTSFAKEDGKTTEIKFSDVAIGDFIVAMGYMSGQGILDAKRILLTGPLEDPIRKVYFGSISKIGKKEITLKDNTGNESTLTFPSKWKGPEIKELQEGMKIIAIAYPKDQKLNVRTLTIITSETQ